MTDVKRVTFEAPPWEGPGGGVTVNDLRQALRKLEAQLKDWSNEAWLGRPYTEIVKREIQGTPALAIQDGKALLTVAYVESKPGGG